MDYQAARRHMVESQVRPNDVTDLRIQNAMETTPREEFLPPEFREQAYAECEIPYATGRTMLRARDFAKLLAAAKPVEKDLVLAPVCGSGYSTAILSQLTEMVVSIESDEELAAKAEENLSSLGYDNAAVIAGDPLEGAAGQGPFDLIFIGGAIEIRPEKLLAQLKEGGRLAAIWREGGVSRGGCFLRSGDNFAFKESFDAATAAVALGFEKPKSFQF